MGSRPHLNCRLKGGRDPIRLVVDSLLKIPPRAKIFSSSKSAPLWIATTERAGWDRIKGLQSLANQVIVCVADAGGRVDLSDLMKRLGDREVTSVLSEAGGILSGALLRSGLADQLALFLAPKLIGGGDAPGLLAPGLLEGAGVGRLADARRLSEMRVTPVGEDILVEGVLV